MALAKQRVWRGADIPGWTVGGGRLDLPVLEVHGPDQLREVVVGGTGGARTVPGVGEGGTAAGPATHDDGLVEGRATRLAGHGPLPLEGDVGGYSADQGARYWSL